MVKNYNPKDFTSIAVKKETRTILDDCKVHPRETMWQLIDRWAKAVIQKKQAKEAKQ